MRIDAKFYIRFKKILTGNIICWKSLNKVGIWNEIYPFLCYHKSIGL